MEQKRMRNINLGKLIKKMFRGYFYFALKCTVNLRVHVTPKYEEYACLIQFYSIKTIFMNCFFIFFCYSFIKKFKCVTTKSNNKKTTKKVKKLYFVRI